MKSRSRCERLWLVDPIEMAPQQMPRTDCCDVAGNRVVRYLERQNRDPAEWEGHLWGILDQTAGRQQMGPKHAHGNAAVAGIPCHHRHRRWITRQLLSVGVRWLRVCVSNLWWFTGVKFVAKFKNARMWNWVISVLFFAGLCPLSVHCTGK